MKLNIVAARTGLTWVRMGLRTYFRQPLALTGLFFMYTTTVLLLAVVPVIGVVIGGLLVPAASLGLMAATAEAEKGRFPLPSVLLSAFRAGRQQLRAMLVLGAFYAAGSLLASGLATLLAGDGVIAPPPGASAEAQMASLDPAMGLALLFHLPLFAMFWHAPALVHWHGVTPAKSLFFSLVAVLRNLGARHVGYGVREEHYVTVGTALLWTLSAGLGEKFTPEVREAWTAAYGLLADVMQFGALEAERIKRHQQDMTAA